MVVTEGVVVVVDEPGGAALEAALVGRQLAEVLAAPVEGLGDTRYMDVFDPDEPGGRPINFMVNPFGHPLAIGQLGGPFARDLEREGRAAMVDFAQSALISAFGADFRKRILKAATTHWSSDPHVLGAYSCARPGRAEERRILSEPIEERLFLAGEAVSIDAFSTCHGAHLSGLAVAHRIAATRLH